MKLLSLLWLLPAYPLVRRCSRGAFPLRTGLLSAALGLSGLAASCILSPVTGLPVAINFFTVSVASLLGLPGVICVMAAALFA